MYVATNRLFVPPERAEEFEEKFTGNMRNYLPGVPGLRRSTLLRPQGQDQPYVSINEFDTEQHFRDWVNSASFKEAHDSNRTMSRHIEGNAVETFHPLEDLVL